MNQIIKLHLGICSNCHKTQTVTCYRLPIRHLLNHGESNECEVELGKHIDSCFSCIARQFETYN